MPKVEGNTMEEIMANRQKRKVQVGINVNPENDCVDITIRFPTVESLDALNAPDFGEQIRGAIETVLVQYKQAKISQKVSPPIASIGVTGGAMLTQ